MKEEGEKIRVIYKKTAGMAIFIVCAFWAAAVGLRGLARADVCARVKIEILQELTFERVAFDAMMKINNESDIPLTNIYVDVSLANPAGEDVASLFFVRLTSMDNIGAVDGTGTVEPFSTAEIHWLIIPSAGAGGEVPSGQIYYAGATLGYNMGGVQEVTQVVPDSIVVKPQPLLVLDYFEPRFVYGDDPFTPATEPPIPYNLGVRVRNIGFGYAKSLVIDSGQPKIVENEQGLLIDFRILGSEINGNSAPNNLLVNFGDIAPQGCGTARWEMVSTLSGEFIEFAVSFTHSDELGGELTSLIQDTYAHLLVHEVMMDSSGRDRIKDFLAYYGDTLFVFESDNLDTEVTDVSQGATLNGAPSSFNPNVSLEFAPEAGAVYVRLPDPAGGNIQLESVTRSDGKTLLGDNYWISKEREEHQWHAYVNVFDVNSTGSYTVTYLTGDLDDSVPPVSHIEIEEPQFSQDPIFVNRNTEFLFLATDELSGVNQILFRIDGGTFGPAINPFMFSQRPAYTDGPHTLYFYSRDNEGNEETAKSTNIYLDTQAPVIESFTATPSRILPEAPAVIAWAARTLAIDYSVSDDTGQVMVDVEIYAGGEASSYKIWEYQQTVSSGASSQVMWEGIDESGAIVPPGSYTLRMRVTDPLGQTTLSEAIALEVGAYFSDQELSACDACEQKHPAISQNVVVWQDNRNGDFDIYLYDIAEQLEMNLTPISGDQTHPVTDGSRVVWQDNRNGNDDIYLYDRATEEEKCIGCDNNSQIKPAISGEWIVWQDNRYGNWDIFVYNMTTEEVRNITENIDDQVNPSISDHIVTWEDYRHGLGEIYSLDLSTGEDLPLTDDEVNQTNPVISEGKVAWIDQSTGTRRIYLYDRAEGVGSFITEGLSESAQAALAGGYMIYTDYSQGVNDPNPYFHILTTDIFLPITQNPASQEEPDIYGNRAVWQDQRSGQWRIYMADVSDYFPDEDDDGVYDEVDTCPDTPVSEEADSHGCSASQRDSDGDGIHDDVDNCPTIPNQDVEPIVEAGENQTVDEGDEVSFSGDYTDPLGGTPTIVWDFGDGITEEGTLFPNHTYEAMGVYTVILKVTNECTEGTDTLTVTVNNVIPIVEAGGDQTENEGSAVTFAGSYIAPGEGTYTIAWDFGDGTTSQGSLTPNHAYSDNAVYTVTLTVTDDEGAVGTDTLTVTVNNVAPTAEAGEDQTVDEGVIVNFAGSYSDPGADTHTIVWDFGDGTTGQGSLTLSHEYTDNGVYTVTLTVTDDEGAVGTNTLTVTVNNVAPTAEAGEDQTVDEGVIVNFAASYTDPGADTHTIAWDFGDGTIEQDTSLTPTHAYADNGVYTVTLTVTDDEGAVGTDTLIVTVNNVAPTAEAGADQTVDEGVTVNFAGSYSDPGADTHRIVWDFGDGTIEQDTSLTPTHAYADNGIYTVTLTVTDDEGAVGTDTLTITVNNVAPTAEAGEDQSMDEGAIVNFAGSYTDPGADTHTVAWDFGDNSTAQESLTPTHAYADNGVYTVTLTVTDDEGAIGTDTLTVTVNNVAPTAEAGEDQSVDEGAIVNFAGSYTDPGADTHTIAWDFGDGTIVQDTILTPTHAYADNGVYTVTLAVTDDEGAVGMDTLTVTVNNVAPTVGAGEDQTVNEGVTVSFAGNYSDPGADTHTIAWDFGDGTIEQDSSLTPTHAYADNGVYTVTLTVTDDEGAVGTDTLTVTVNNVAPTAEAGEDQTVDEGTMVNLTSSTFNDPGTLDTHTALIDWGDGTAVEAGIVIESPFGPPGTIDGADGVVNGSHVYADNGHYTVTISVTDDDGATATDTFAIIVNNVGPTIESADDQTVGEGFTVNFGPSVFNDRGTLDTHVAMIDWGDGTAVATGTISEFPFGPPGSVEGADGTVSGSHEYGDNGINDVTVTVSDDDGDAISDTIAVTVLNVIPTVEAGDDISTTCGDFVTFSGSFSDPGWLDTHTALWDFGENTIQPGEVTEENNPLSATGTIVGENVFYDKGTYTVTLTVTDDDQGTGADILEAIVKPIGASIDIEPEALNPKCKRKWITCTVELPEGYGVEMIAEKPDKIVIEQKDTLTLSQQTLFDSLIQRIEQTTASVEIEIKADADNIRYSVSGYLGDHAEADFQNLIRDLNIEGNKATVGIKKQIKWNKYSTLIDISTVLLNNQLPAEIDSKHGFVKTPKLHDRDGNGLPEVTVKFDMKMWQEIAMPMPGEDVELVVTGKVYYNLGRADFEGLDTVTIPEKKACKADNVIDKKKNDSPKYFKIKNPKDNSDVHTLMPTLEVSNSNDEKKDVLIYTFEVYEDNNLNNLVIASPNIEEGDKGKTSWQLPVALTNNSWYYWRVIARDSDGAAAITPVASFFVIINQDSLSTPILVNPSQYAHVNTITPQLEVVPVEEHERLSYLFEVYTDPLLITRVRQGSVTIPQWIIAPPLIYNAWYYWRVQAQDEQGLQSDWSESASFFIQNLMDGTSSH